MFLATLLMSFLPACQYEDSLNCYWDAQSRGNGTGQSFVVLDTGVDVKGHDLVVMLPLPTTQPI